MSRILTFEDLEAWKNSRDLRRYACQIVKSLPKDERFRLADQIIRSARSVTANIAEGYGRFHYQENLQFCRQARGSLYETLDHFIAGHDERLISEEVLVDFRVRFADTLRILNGYISYLDKASREKRSHRLVREELAAYTASPSNQ